MHASFTSEIQNWTRRAVFFSGHCPSSTKKNVSNIIHPSHPSVSASFVSRPSLEESSSSSLSLSLTRSSTISWMSRHFLILSHFKLVSYFVYIFKIYLSLFKEKTSMGTSCNWANCATLDFICHLSPRSGPLVLLVISCFSRLLCFLSRCRLDQPVRPARNEIRTTRKRENLVRHVDDVLSQKDGSLARLHWHAH